jgi:Cdc6-like AAA superfamily ATPase
MQEHETKELVFRCSRVFSPAAPINNLDLFAGRLKQIERISDAINTRGQHAVIFGERGVGKTSFANIIKDLLISQGALVAKINCQDDDYQGAWRKALAEMDISIEQELMGITRRKKTTRFAADQLFDSSFGPGEIRRFLQGFNRDNETVVIFDEFDRLLDGKTQRLFADTIKDLSDNSIATTLILVGVADDVDDLIEEHASIDRALIQIQMPRMPANELKDIVNKALGSLGMSMKKEGLELIVLLSQGLPHYTHLLGKESAITALKRGKKTISLAHVREGVTNAVEHSMESVQNAYQKAIRSHRKVTLFRDVLLACAIAEVDDQGYFASADVRDPLCEITGKSYDIPNFSQHLDKFSSDKDRGPVLERSGSARRFRFRFVNPLLQPYIIMRGLSDGSVTQDILALLQKKQKAQN